MKTFLIALGGLVALTAMAIAMRSGTYSVERTASVKASPDTISALVANVPEWASFSAFARKDPQVKVACSTVSSGQGATCEFSGGEKIGSGSIRVTAANASHVALEFNYASQSPAQLEFDLTRENELTLVRARMSGNRDLGEKFFGMVMNVNQLVGRDLDATLSGLKARAEQVEAAARAPAPVAPDAASEPSP